jgi:CDP-diacylglycerol--serine O-phosphatidyltransferase
MFDEMDSQPVDGRLHHLQPLSRLFPSMITLLALCLGLSSIRFALLSRWELAVTFIIIAAFVDSLDGRIARMLNATSNFGAHLDSLVDFANFGVAPAILLYLWKVDTLAIPGIGWAVILIYAICAAIRLAKFNTHLDDDDRPEWADGFFSGMPSPAAALLVLSPLMLSFYFSTISLSPTWIAMHLVFSGLMMIIPIPMFSGKKITVRRKYIPLILLLAGGTMAGILIEPWLVLPMIMVLYLMTMPWSWFKYKGLIQNKDRA